ncbi:DUF3035 domain-containing protein [Sneathiella sp. P13V-1]|uniref:DUF3035 domain-containing protein n=1 Tax=Sneathiella sp. P13V-1 TaxID=2697366 RepID=UPI00187BB791|nr:DUF3035 domain-containing protein [Sneathiella sp. P13V-1]MBE7638497.1 DUF3035 domain-containing protein [Sneathiella sp. P13V-1]
MADTKKIFAVAAISIGALTLAGCDSTRQALGIDGKKAPDEFAVITKAPLIIPPDFTLRPPTPGQRSPRDELARNNAQTALLGRSSSNGVITQQEARAAGTSAGELALLRQADAENVDSSIREIVNRETSVLAENDNSLLEKVMFWQKQPKFGTVVDPTKEQKRIQENAALGNSASDGGDTPIIERKKRALLEGLFD